MLEYHVYKLECYTAEAKFRIFMHGLSALDAIFSLTREDDMDRRDYGIRSHAEMSIGVIYYT